MAQTQITQNTTQTQTPWRKGIEFVIECLRHRKSVRKSISEIIPESSEEWTMFVYRIAGAIDTIRMRLEKRLEDEKQNPEKAYEKLIEIMEKAVMSEVEKIEKSLNNFPISIFLTTSQHEDIQICVDLAKYVDRQKFNEYVNIVGRLGLRYNGRANCKQAFKL